MAENSGGQRHDRSALILYGTETGNSQDAAEQLGRLAERLRFHTRVCSMDAVDIKDLLNNTILIFIIATTGQGDMPANARKLWKSLLRKRLPPDCLNHVRFTTFGLGDSSYVKFNWAARKLHKRLEQLGAEVFYPRGEADEQHEEGTDGAFLPWSYNLKPFLLENFPLPEGQLPIPDSELLPPKVTLELRAAQHGHNVNAPDTDLVPNSAPQPGDSETMDGPITKDRGIKDAYSLKDLEITDKTPPPADILPIPFAHHVDVIENRRLTAENHWQDVRHICLRSHEMIRYKPGDIITIYPKNFPEDVNTLIELQDWTDIADLPICFKAPGGNFQAENFMPELATIPTTEPPTLRSLLLHNLDITSIPRRYFFDICAKFTSDEEHRERLLEFGNPAYTDEFFDYTTRPRRSILEVLHEFSTVKLPWRWALTIFPPLRGRQFSISSGGILKHPSPDETIIHITVALVKYRTVLRKIRQGVCSRYLSTLKPGTRIGITFTHGAIRGVIEQCRPFSRPILMIAPGTGVAPMRSLIYERAYILPLLERRNVTQSPIDNDDGNTTTSTSNTNSADASGTITHPHTPPNPPITLIYGCRNKNADYIYSRDWKIPELGLNVLPAFSRDQSSKFYVQDVIRANPELIWAYLGPLDGGNGSYPGGAGTVFVCGSSGKMPESVRKALVSVFRQMGSWSEDVADGYLKTMEKQGRFVQETW